VRTHSIMPQKFPKPLPAGHSQSGWQLNRWLGDSSLGFVEGLHSHEWINRAPGKGVTIFGFFEIEFVYRFPAPLPPLLGTKLFAGCCAMVEGNANELYAWKTQCSELKSHPRRLAPS